MGPFQKLGEAIVKSCINVKTDYVDITGETHWVKEMIEKYHETAVKNNVLIVPMCGFDSVPADLGCYLTVQTLRSQYNTPTTHVHGFIKTKGGASGSYK
jgi:short subunit dehydrogenase-like uncharacterized protein